MEIGFNIPALLVTKAPAISVIIVTWNSAPYLARCLEALTIQGNPGFEVILVDNASTDATVRIADGYSSRLNLHRCILPYNLGFAYAANYGARQATGTWLAMLNPDSFPAPDWLQVISDAASRHPQASGFASRLMQDGSVGRLDGAGDRYHASGLSWRHGYGCPASHAMIETEVFSVCAAAALFRREEFLRIGGFDEDYFCYHEDVDLCFRLRLQGGRFYYIPRAAVTHLGSAAKGRKSSFVIYHGHRNLVWTYFKNMPSPLIQIYLPLHLMMSLFMLFYYTLRGKPRAIWQAKIDAYSGLYKTLRKRVLIQRERRVLPEDIRRQLSHFWQASFWQSAWRRS